MSVRDKLPTGVLSQRLVDVIDGRRVRVAVFTTFTFDPGFFELNVLPLLFDQSFSQVDKVRRIQLEDALRNIDELAVYYDRRALAQDAEPAQLDYRRLDVRRTTGCFHPKLVFLLVDEEVDEDEIARQALIVGVLSANLTRAGWWENVECAHFEEIKDISADESRVPFRKDLLSLINRLAKTAHPDDGQTALDAIQEFVLKRTLTGKYSRARASGSYLTRLFCGQQSFSTWLADLPLSGNGWNLEVVSPYFDEAGAGPLQDLMGIIAPKEARVYLPTAPDGSAEVSPDTHDAIAGLDARWCKLPGELVDRGRDTAAGKLPPRRVHAKLYRLWRRDGSDVLIVGSINLTSSAHSHGAAGNLEAAFLVDVSSERYPRQWWLQPLEAAPQSFTDRQPQEDDAAQDIPIDLSLRFDWATRSLAYRIESGERSDLGVYEIGGGAALFGISEPKTDGKWHELSSDAAEKCAATLESSSFLLVKHTRGSWRVLVREENMAHRPSLFRQLSPEEILEYWALLTQEQRAAFIEDRLAAGETLEGIPVTRGDVLKSRNTLFDRFAGIYHSFGCLRGYVTNAIEEGRLREVEARLFGAKYDSLPVLLERSLEVPDGDPVLKYVTFLCAKQLRDWLQKNHRELLPKKGNRLEPLDSLLDRLPDLRAPLMGDIGADGEEFLGWYERVFLKELTR